MSITTQFFAEYEGEGQGASVMRLVGNPMLKDLDPLIMLDFFRVRLPAGFPDHPHRGFETVTYLLSGSVYHEDFKGNKGIINPGDVQWMTAGRGIVHAEMPGSAKEDSIGFQLWVNLPKEKKMCDAQYQDFLSEDIAEHNEEGLKVRIIAGESYGVKGRVDPNSPSTFFDVHLAANKEYVQKIQPGWHGLVFIYDGKEGAINTEKTGKKSDIKFQQVTAFDSKDGNDTLSIKSNQNCKFIVIAGCPLNQEVAKKGPFVMCTEQELHKTFEDYEDAKNGFEPRRNWRSKIRYMSQDVDYRPF